MSVVPTKKWLKEFAKQCEQQGGRGALKLHRELICVPLAELFPDTPVEAYQYELLNNGLFMPEEWETIEGKLATMESQRVWRLVESEYLKLRKKWKGPKVPIYIFPLQQSRIPSEGQLNRNGIAYKNALFLFFSPEIKKEEIIASVAHEYNHICRLHYLDRTPKEIKLRDSIIIEGMGEYAVKEICGEDWLAPWVNLYTKEEALPIWKEHFIPALKRKGVKNHQLFLFGQPRTPFPRWIGYHLGYQIVDSFVKNKGPFKHGELYTKSANEIILGSDFAP